MAPEAHLKAAELLREVMAATGGRTPARAHRGHWQGVFRARHH